LLLILPAWAKINLSLDILGLLPGGYHRLETVMQSLTLHDRLEFITVADGIIVSCDSPEVPAGPGNLVYRAAELMQQASGTRSGVHIHLQKEIPVAAGLGGGSADAAAALLGLNRLWGLNWPLAKLIELGAQLGSDVPFCLAGGTMLARGRGEQLAALPALPPMGVVLVKPPLAVSTAKVYRGYDRCPAVRERYTPSLVQAVNRGDFFGICATLGNALEVVTTGMHPVISELKESLRAAGAAGVLMSGSGPTVFGLGQDLGAARRIAGSLRVPAGTLIIVTETHQAI
jgi:4-diphosphocytidyl-2-C-methyl-D-erythritol kinase